VPVTWRFVRAFSQCGKSEFECKESLGMKCEEFFFDLLVGCFLRGSAIPADFIDVCNSFFHRAPENFSCADAGPKRSEISQRQS
jgi:hypothetical protein